MKTGLYSITYLGIWYRGKTLSIREFIARAKQFGFDGVELGGKRPHANITGTCWTWSGRWTPPT